MRKLQGRPFYAQPTLRRGGCYCVSYSKMEPAEAAMYSTSILDSVKVLYRGSKANRLRFWQQSSIMRTDASRCALPLFSKQASIIFYTFIGRIVIGRIQHYRNKNERAVIIFSKGADTT